MTTNIGDNDARELCRELLFADTEAEVIHVLEARSLWSSEECWRYLGDIENNFASIGNQQSEAVAALIEKVVNSIDARLTNACLAQRIDPASAQAPASIREGVARFFEGRSPGILGENDGRIATWSDAKMTEEAQLITLAATGRKPSEGLPSLTISDQGEGQTPYSFPDTFMSLTRANKMRIPFVQGKYNMGGNGALAFAANGTGLELVLSRRNPELLDGEATPSDANWGFTIVRREPPTGLRRSSVYRYLAPVDAGDSRGRHVLSFPGETFPLFPEVRSSRPDPYAREAPYGTAVKLYEYGWRGTTSNIVRSGDGLLRRLDQGLPELALPVRLYECRDYGGHSGSYATNLLGLSARLERDRADKLEDIPQPASVIDVGGRQVKVRVFVFRPGQANEYRTNRNAVIFTVNGQAHATLAADFFRRGSIRLSYLAESLLVLVDCTNVDGSAREDLFMNSRDRLRDNAESFRLIQELESFLREDQTLHHLAIRRQQEELAGKLANSKPLENLLTDILRRSPALARFLLQGTRLPSPFPPHPGAGDAATPFAGKRYPTYFHFRGLQPGEELHRSASMGGRARIHFQTDAEDDYFVRTLDPGEWHIYQVAAAGHRIEVHGNRMDGPHRGVATLSLDLPPDSRIGNSPEFDIEVTDETQLGLFLNRLRLRIEASSQSGGGGGTPPSSNKSRGSGPGSSSGLALPQVYEVSESEWPRFSFHRFDEDTALVIQGTAAEASADAYTFYVNVDNKYLRASQKESPDAPDLLKEKFKNSLVIIGLALIQALKADRSTDAADEAVAEIEGTINKTTMALAPILLPLLDGVATLSPSDEL